MYTTAIPFTNPHGGIVIGSGGKTIKAIQHQTGCFIEARKAEPASNRKFPFFLLRCHDEKAINLASIEIYRLLNTSMMNSQQSAREEIDALTQKNQHSELCIAELKESVHALTYTATNRGVQNVEWMNQVQAARAKQRAVASINEAILMGINSDPDSDDDDEIPVASC